MCCRQDMNHGSNWWKEYWRANLSCQLLRRNKKNKGVEFKHDQVSINSDNSISSSVAASLSRTTSLSNIARPVSTAIQQLHSYLPVIDAEDSTELPYPPNSFFRLVSKCIQRYKPASNECASNFPGVCLIETAGSWYIQPSWLPLNQ